MKKETICNDKINIVEINVLKKFEYKNHIWAIHRVYRHDKKSNCFTVSHYKTGLSSEPQAPTMKSTIERFKGYINGMSQECIEKIINSHEAIN